MRRIVKQLLHAMPDVHDLGDIAKCIWDMKAGFIAGDAANGATLTVDSETDLQW